MQLKTRIIVDSTADLVPEIKERVYTVPLTVHFGQEEYIDGVTIDKHRFYERLVESDELPTTSQASPAAFDAIFSDVASVGDSAVVVTLASKFSGTYQSACIAAAEYDNIYVVDSKSAAIGSGILAEYALECADKGMDAKTIAETLEKKRDEICLIALLDTLEYLKKGGRISKTVAFAGGLLNIKPVITVVDGEIQVIGKARGSKQGNNLLVQKIHESGGIDFDDPRIQRAERFVSQKICRGQPRHLAGQGGLARLHAHLQRDRHAHWPRRGGGRILQKGLSLYKNQKQQEAGVSHRLPAVFS